MIPTTTRATTAISTIITAVLHSQDLIHRLLISTVAIARCHSQVTCLQTLVTTTHITETPIILSTLWCMQWWVDFLKWATAQILLLLPLSKEISQWVNQEWMDLPPDQMELISYQDQIALICSLICLARTVQILWITRVHVIQNNSIMDHLMVTITLIMTTMAIIIIPISETILLIMDLTILDLAVMDSAAMNLHLTF